MYLVGARLVRVPPFEDVTFPFCDADDRARLMTVVHGGAGVGKTSLLAAIVATRPGHAVAFGQPRSQDPNRPTYALCEWQLGDDEPERPHALSVCTPTLRVASDDERALLQRREQALFDKRASEGGFVFLAFPSMRWFSRAPISITAPLRGVARYDVRASTSVDDSSSTDLARECKQALAYAAVSAALRQRAGVGQPDARVFGDAMMHAVQTLAALSGVRYIGVDPISLEPMFLRSGGARVTFDGLPTQVRHLVAFAALTTRALWAAYHDKDPRKSEGVVVIDDVELHQDTATLTRLPLALREALPRVQWILTTASPTIAEHCDVFEVLALRRSPDVEVVELFVGIHARTH